MDEIAKFADRLRQLLDTRNITAAELARKTGISKSSICRYLKGDWKAKQDTIYKIAEAADCSEAWLMGANVPMRRSGLIATQYSADYPEDDMPLLDENGEPMIYSDERAIRQTLRENRELRMLLSASSKLNKDDLEQLIRLAKLMDKE